ncbi:CRE-CAL-5 protein [Aphelenchoides besseyi]|nr:CRE-CAL-5 protein [Aphelenchoides besseyi]
MISTVSRDHKDERFEHPVLVAPSSDITNGIMSVEEKQIRPDVGEGGDEIREDDLRGIFREFDINGDGFIQVGGPSEEYFKGGGIQKNELRAVMIKMGQSPTDEELAAMFSAADKDNDGNIDFNEFLTIARANPLSLSLKAVFEELDVDGDGHITRSELRTAFQRMGHALTDQEIKAIYKHVDLNHDGKINFKEFCQMMTRNKK